MSWLDYVLTLILIAIIAFAGLCGCSAPSLTLVTVVLPGGRMNVGSIHETRSAQALAERGAVAYTPPGMHDAEPTAGTTGALGATKTPAAWKPLN